MSTQCIKVSLEEIKKQLEKQSKFKELQKNEGISFEDFSIIKGVKYIQKARSGYNIYIIVIDEVSNKLSYDYGDMSF